MKTVQVKVMAMALLMMAALTQGVAQEGQKRFGFELNGGGSFALTKLDDVTLNPGFGFEGVFHYRILKEFGIYGGWGWNRMGADQSFAGNDVCFEETGYVLGLQYRKQLGSLPLSFYLRGAGLYNHLEVENADGDIIHDTGHGFGWQAATGLEYHFGNNWSLTPGVKFNALVRESDYEGVTRDLTLNYLQVRVGIVKRF
jgi:hypothetical protein